MALNAISAHKLRSSLTLLGILIGVFSIIVVATAIRALQGNIEREMSQLGSDTFQLQRFPAIQVDDDSESFEKYMRRKRFYLDSAKALRERVTLARHVSTSADADRGEVQSRFGKTVTAGWQADSFGHSAGLPEILAAGGINFFAFSRPSHKVVTLAEHAFS